MFDDGRNYLECREGFISSAVLSTPQLAENYVVMLAHYSATKISSKSLAYDTITAVSCVI